MNDQRDAAKIEKTFVPPHARACAARKYKGSDLAAAFHNRPAILRLVLLLDQSAGDGRNLAAKFATDRTESWTLTEEGRHQVVPEGIRNVSKPRHIANEGPAPSYFNTRAG